MTQPLSFDTTRLPCPHTGESHDAWRKSVRNFVDKEIAPHVNEWDEAGAFPRTLHKQAAEFGLIGLGVPERYGGIEEGVDVFHSIIASEELARAGSGGLVAGLMTHGIGLPPIIAMGTEELKQRIAPSVLSGRCLIALCVTEPSGGSDVSRIKTKAKRKDQNYIVNGEKTFITTGMRADFLTVAVRSGGDGAGGLSFLLVEANRPGVTRTPLDKMGWWMSDTATIHFLDVEVPVEKVTSIGRRNTAYHNLKN